jgi:hypothetical protein
MSAVLHFSDIYQIYSLKNQTSDLIQRSLLKKALSITPKIMLRIYGSTSDGSILQELFCLRFVTLDEIRYSYRTFREEVLSEWEKVFEQFSNLGRDYFRHS